MARISIQMWTVRQEAERSLPATLASLKRIGYGAVETAGLYGLSPASMRAELASAGLELSSAHTPLPTLETAAATFGQLTELGATAVFPSLKPESFADDAAIGRAADAFNAVLPMAREHGIELGYHNHWWEFERGPDGQLAYQKFLDRLDPDVTVEVDTYWMQVGGVDAADFVRSLGDRAHYLHIKDGPINTEADNQSAVGDGKMDVDRVLEANDAVLWHVVELDGYRGDIWEAVSRSFQYLSSPARDGTQQA
jgi:sugar phosphate isomerase/epimerase